MDYFMTIGEASKYLKNKFINVTSRPSSRQSKINSGLNEFLHGNSF
jgi:hypothetical protein